MLIWLFVSDVSSLSYLLYPIITARTPDKIRLMWKSRMLGSLLGSS